jgi:hypothetical protein
MMLRFPRILSQALRLVVFSALALTPAFAADEQTIVYYLPKTSLLVEMDVMEKKSTKGPLLDFVPVFFPSAEAAKETIVKDDLSTFSIDKKVTISAIGSPDLDQVVEVKSKGAFKDITAGMTFDDAGNVTEFKYGIRDRKWDFIFKLLIGAAKIAGAVLGSPLSLKANLQGEGMKNFAALVETGECALSKVDMTESERTYFKSPELRPLLAIGFCAAPADYRGSVKLLNESGGVGHDAFVGYFGEELCSANSTALDGCPANPKKTFRSAAGILKLNRFFQAWNYVRELESIQNSREALLSQKTGIPQGAEGMRLVLAEQEKRIAYIGEQFFGTEEKSVYWHPVFRVDFEGDVALNGPVTLFYFKNDPKTPVGKPKAASIAVQGKPGAAIVRTLNPWPSLAADMTGYEPITINLAALSKTGKCDTSATNQLRFRIPVLYGIATKSKDSDLALHEVYMSQGGACRSIPVADKNATVSFVMNPKTGALKSLSLDNKSAATPETADQLLGLTSAILGAKAASDAANATGPGPSPMQLLELQVRQKVLEACVAAPLTAECIQYLKK